MVQYWNGVANENKKVTLAVRASSEIKECIWTHLDSDEEYRYSSNVSRFNCNWCFLLNEFMVILRLVNTLFVFSEGDKKKNDVEVKIDKFDKKDKKKTLCRLEIKKVFLTSWIAVFSSLGIIYKSMKIFLSIITIIVFFIFRLRKMIMLENGW